MKNSEEEVTFELLGVVDVDSGQMILTDPAYLEEWEVDKFKGSLRPVEVDGYLQAPYSYSGACALTLSKNSGGEMAFTQTGESGAGIAFNCPSGDGPYPVVVIKNESGQILEVRVLLDERLFKNYGLFSEDKE